MIEHIGNCHGEWNGLFMILGSLPFVGLYIKAWWHKRHEKKHRKEG